jgi:hypothetical protein
MTARWNVLFIAAAAILINSTASIAQTKEQCAGLANLLLPLITSISPTGEYKEFTGINWNIVIPHTSGSFRTAAENVKRAQDNFLNATVQYRRSLEDVAREAQLCAR